VGGGGGDGGDSDSDGSGDDGDATAQRRRNDATTNQRRDQQKWAVVVAVIATAMGCHCRHPPPSISRVHCLIVVSFLFHCRHCRRRPLIIVVDVRRPSTLSSVILPLPRCTV
jgi:hypothetical protein